MKLNLQRTRILKWCRVSGCVALSLGVWKLHVTRVITKQAELPFLSFLIHVSDTWPASHLLTDICNASRRNQTI